MSVCTVFLDVALRVPASTVDNSAWEAWVADADTVNVVVAKSRKLKTTVTAEDDAGTCLFVIVQSSPDTISRRQVAMITTNDVRDERLYRFRRGLKGASVNG
eukprot:TRINITY_DN24228_c0_g1_i1.p1 TRINITY_DN24228_c0_g1~~TRINITY_DN24228_c0_g1_i1.p1  ORF type:complete len:102 (+),score=14.62 TRINITY_DN24228_c0_g1_i1:62-367(+)